MTFSTKQQTIGLLGVTLLAGLASCTNLDDKVFGQLSSTEASATSVPLDPASSLAGAYASLNDIATNQGNTYAMEEHPSDEMLGPTRGTDWDDFGQWRKLHQHNWDAFHPQVIGTWDDLNRGAFRATQALSIASATAQQKAEASFLRAFYTFYIVDLYGQVPFRQVTDAADANPRVYTRQQATNLMISDLRSAFNNSGATAPNVATKNAAATMLAKVYLNRAVYNQDVANAAGPYTFAKADMDSSIYFANQVIASGKYALTPNYFDNFHWENDSRSKELIFTIVNTSASQPGNVRNRYFMTTHYNQDSSSLGVNGWNGFTTLGDFYNSFEATDGRRAAAIPGGINGKDVTAGFLVGQQTNAYTGRPIRDRSGNPLVFTPDINIAYALEPKGIRVIKYFPKAGERDNPTNDYVFLRYADVLLMKAEAILRGGTDPQGQTAAGIVNNLRTTRKATALATVDLTALLAERGRELYWEGWRRNDQIRFGTFLNPVDQRAVKSPNTAVLFPLPQRALDSNPNLKQNPGY
ncbi:RagB/SusD family nutrient uptake outer membrane protein [Fibrella aquatilis]|uniref:RagB/SusD family nutrient uptake outer membrane protein n=1 Tax=Fibrella aquatilis TaxID=2817059 RepID=A0A939G661_9BACT|nr:RagB/SusD family nutrient uptake outer membrane protein [Fibrella aquatilis]MBO0931125.1 RagB/SusD family nutrient uptake outer membrane protein [Fibrella aquatilis]